MYGEKRNTFLVFGIVLLVAIFSGCVGEKPALQEGDKYPPSQTTAPPTPQGEEPGIQEVEQYQIGKPHFNAGSRWEFDVISNGEKGHLVAVAETENRDRISGFWDRLNFYDNESNIVRVISYTQGLKFDVNFDQPYRFYDYPLYDKKKWDGKVDMNITVYKNDSKVGNGKGADSFSGEVIELVDYVFQDKEYTCAKVRVKKNSETLIDYSGSPVKTASKEEDEMIVCPDIGEVEARLSLNTTTEAGEQTSEQSTKIEFTMLSFEAGKEGGE